MLYQVTFSPAKDEDLKCHRLDSKVEDIPVLTLAPFTCNPKVYFDDVKQGTIASRKLQIVNPTKNNLEVTLVKYPTEDRKLSYSWIQNVIRAESSLQLEITWRPIETGGFCESIILKYGHNLKKSVSISCKCIALKKKSRRIYNSPVKLRALKKKTIRKTPTRRFKTQPDIAKRKNPELTTQTSDFAISTPAITTDVPILKNNDEHIIKLQEIHVTPISRRLRSPDTKLRRSNVPLKKRFARKIEFNEKTFVVKKKRQTLLKSDEETFIVKKHINEKTFVVKKKRQLNNQASPRKVRFKDSTETILKNKHRTSLKKLNENTFIVKKTKQLSEDNSLSNKTYIVKRKINNLIETKHNIKKMKTLDQNHDSLQKIQSCISKEYESTSIKPNSDSFPTNTNVGGFNISTDKITFERHLEESRTLEELFKNSFDNLKLTSNNFNVDDKKIINDSQNSSSTVDDNVFKNVTFELPINNNKENVSAVDSNKKDEVQKKRRSDLPQKLFGKKPKPQMNDLHNPDEYLASLNLEEIHIKYNWTNAEESCIKKEVNLLLVPSFECPSTQKPATIDKLLQKCSKPVKNDPNTALCSIRDEATTLFRSPEVFKVISKIIQSVESGKLSVGSDKNIHNNTALQQQIITLLLNYSPTWLRIGLETIFEEIITPKTKSDVNTICEFAMRRLFKNPHLLKKYKSSSSPKYIIEIKKHTLRKLLMLIYFLDYSKRSKIIPNDPCLFRRNAGLKESKDVLHVFSSKILTPVRDIFKFLESIGCRLLHKQTFIHEFSFVVENIEEDFKDGVRLVKLLDVVLSRNSMEMLRVPAISRLQKVYNVKVAFDILMKAGCSISNITQKDIVAGNRAKTLSLLMLILQLQAVDNAGAIF